MRPIRILLLTVVSTIVAAVVAYAVAIRPWIRAWGTDETEAQMALPGDELVAEPLAVETRAVTITAPVSAVWPWLAQLGSGRGGWYSFESRGSKMTSSDVILPEYQSLAAGDILTVSDGGPTFEVKSVDPEHSLVLFTDTSMMRPIVAAEAGAEEASKMPEFSATWGFYLQPTDDGGTRLIERFRAQTAVKGPQAAVMSELMGTGIVLMARKQMLAIKERAERAAFDKPTGSHEPHIEIPDLATDELPEPAAAV